MPISCCNPITMNGAAIVLSFLLIALSSALDCTSNGDCSDSDVCVEGLCVMLPSFKCPKGMHYEQCGSTCPQDCAHLAGAVRLCADFCVRGCFCDAGLFANEEGQCVPKEQCPSASVQITKRDVRERKQDPRCPKNAEYRECTNMCPDKHCGNILEKSSCFSLRCGAPGCMCVEGHVLKTQNIKDGCVRRETCLAEARKSKVQKRYNPFYDIPVPKCKPTESLRSCGSACEPSCAVPHYEYCTYQCAMNACQCKQGLLRHKNGECVRPEECH